MSFLHGVEIVEISGGARPIQTVASSVVGIVGTAPDSLPAQAANGVLGSGFAQTAILCTAVKTGAGGNNIFISLNKPEKANESLVIKVKGGRIDVSLACDAQENISTTATELITALQGDEDTKKIITVANTEGSDGSGILKPHSLFLSGGADEHFPLNTPTLVTGSQAEAAKLGDAGTLPAAMRAIFAQTGAMVVVIRVEECDEDDATQANIIGGVDSATGRYTGISALLGAESIVKVAPKILIAPGFSHEEAVATAFQTIVDQLRAIAIIDGPNTTDSAAIDYRDKFSNKRLYLIDPNVIAFDTITSENQHYAASSYVAGLICRVDNTLGFWFSPSNQPIYGITGTSRPVDFQLGNPNSRANLLNASEVTTIIQHEGYRLWGNRTLSSDPTWAFINVVRTADLMHDSLQRAHLWAVDRNITKTYIEDVAASVNAYLRELIAKGALLGGKCWANSELNTPESLQAGKVYWDFDFTPPAPAERLTFRSHLVNTYYEEVMA